MKGNLVSFSVERRKGIYIKKWGTKDEDNPVIP